MRENEGTKNETRHLRIIHSNPSNIRSTFLTSQELIAQRDRFIDDVRKYSRSVSDQRFEQELERVMSINSGQLPSSVHRAINEIRMRLKSGNGQNNILISLQRDKNDTSSRAYDFYRLNSKDIQGFLDGFPSLLGDFYVYALLRHDRNNEPKISGESQRCVPSPTFENPVPNHNALHKDVVRAFQNDIACELLLDGLMMLKAVRELNIKIPANEVAANTPTLHFSGQHLYSFITGLAHQSPDSNHCINAVHAIEQLLDYPKTALPELFSRLERHKDNHPSRYSEISRNHPSLAGRFDKVNLTKQENQTAFNKNSAGEVLSRPILTLIRGGLDK